MNSCPAFRGRNFFLSFAALADLAKGFLLLYTDLTYTGPAGIFFAKESSVMPPQNVPATQLPTRKGVSLRWLPFFFIFLQSVLYGFGDPISKAAYEVLPVYSLLTARYTIALLFLVLLFGRRLYRGLKASSWRDWLLPSLCMGGAYVANNIGLELTAATSVAFLRSLSTVMTPLLALVFYRKPFGKKHIPIQLLVIVGLYLLCGLGGLSGFGWGEVFSLLSALLLAGSLIFGERALDRVDPVTLTALQTAASVVMALLCALVLDGGIHLSAATPKVWLSILYLALLCTVAGYLLQNAALGFLSSRTVALLQCFCPVMTAFFSRILLGETLSAAGMAGAVIILVCVAAETLLSDEQGPDLSDGEQDAPPDET